MASRATAPAPVAAPRTAEPGRTHAVQRAALKISSPNDAAEREAETTARHVMTMPNPAIAPRERVSLLAARAPAVKAQPRAKANETAPEVTEAIRAARGGGSALSAKTRAFMEPRFKASFAGVRIHTGKAAADLNEKLGARAFAYGRDIFFSPGAYQPDTPGGQELLAHELTHTIQQREVVQREATVQERSTPRVQRGLLGALSDAAGAIANAAGAALDAAIQVVKDFVADKAGILPGFRLLTLIIGKNPINDQPVSGGGAAILREIVGFIPFGDKIVEAFNNHGIFEKGGAFVDTQFKALRHLGGALISGVKGVFKGIGLSDATNPGRIWDRITGFFSMAFSEIKSFGVGLVSGVVTLVRETIIPPLGRWAAANIPKWDLLMAVLGKNPVSEEGESPASQIIGAFMNLIGQGEIWENIKKGNAVNRAWQWFQTALKGAKSLVSGLPGQVMATLRSFTIMDVLTIAGAFRKILALFGSFVGQFGSWAGGTILSLLEIILSVVAPSVVPYLKKAGGAFSTIIKNPAGFVRTLVAAGKLGFSQFAGNFLAHLKAALIGWLTGSLAGAGVYIPAGFSFIEILKFVLSVMGLTWANLRAKLVAATNETTVKALEEGFHIVKTLVTEGPAAAWQEIVKSLTNLKQMAIDAVMDFVKSKIVEIAVTKLLSMLSPAGAFIQAIIAIYNTIMFFVERIRQIAAVAASFIDSIAAIASGNITPAAARVEKTMAGMLVLVISFLARLAGLGKVSDAVVGLIKKIQAPVMKAMDAVVAWIVAGAKKLGTMILQAGVPSAPAERLRLASQASLAIARRLPATGLTAQVFARAHDAIKVRYSLRYITPFQQNGLWFVRAGINPDLLWRAPVAGETAGTGGISRVAVHTGPGGVVTAGAIGELQPGITRRGMESALPRSGALPGLAGSYLQGYRRAHLYGPGFGDETAIGLMYASENVNNQLQSSGQHYGIEGVARQLRTRVVRLGGRVGVAVTASSFADPPPGVPAALGQPVLKRVDYRFTIVNSADQEVRLPRGQATASITCAPPLPGGAGGAGSAAVERLREALDYVGTRSDRTGL